MRLEFPEKKHEKKYYEMIQEFLDIKEKPIPGAVGIKEWENYDDFIWRTKNNAEGKNPKHPGHSTLYFIINDNKNIVWSTQIRHELDDELRFEGGNIGYGIRPSERKKGYLPMMATFFRGFFVWYDDRKCCNVNGVFIWCSLVNWLGKG